MPPALRRAVFERDGWACVRCSKRARLECDHVTPVSEGGATAPDNLQTLCRSCHSVKTAREIGQAPGAAEWLAFVHKRKRRGARRGA